METTKLITGDSGVKRREQSRASINRHRWRDPGRQDGRNGCGETEKGQTAEGLRNGKMNQEGEGRQYGVSD